MKRCPFCAEAIQDAAVVCRFCGRDVHPHAGDPRSALARVLRGGEIALGIGAIAMVAYLLLAPDRAQPLWGLLGASAQTEPDPAAAAPMVLSLLDAETLDIAAGKHFDTTFVVSDPRPCTFSGRIEGLAGGARDVEVYVLDERGFEQWHRGVHPTSLFESGRASQTDLEVSLPSPGRYALLLSNRYSIFTDKTVQVHAARVVCE